MGDKTGTRVGTALGVLFLLIGASLVIVPSDASAFQDGDFLYSVGGSPASATINGYVGSGGAVIIPSTLGGYPTVAIAEYAFFASGLTSVIIPDSVISIGNSAFSYSNSLTSISIGEAVSSIGPYAIIDCASLTTIVVSTDNPTYVSSDGILYNKALTLLLKCPDAKIGEFVIPIGVEAIGDSAFCHCSLLTSVDIPSSVTSIGFGAFSSCNCLTTFVIPDSVTEMGDAVFSDCTSLTSVTISNSITAIGSYAFSQCTSLMSATIPDAVTSIGDYAFAHCALSSVTIPNGITIIGNYSFSDCVSLTSVSIGNGTTIIGYYSFMDCISLTSVDIGRNVTYIGDYSFSYCTALRSLNFFGLAPPYAGSNWIANTFPGIRGHAYAFSSFPSPGNDFYGLTMGVSLSGEYAYDVSEGMAIITGYYGAGGDVIIPSTLDGYPTVAIGEGAFGERSSITSVIVPSGVTSIGASAFAYCYAMTSIAIPDSVTFIGETAFAFCTSLVSLNIPMGVNAINNATFNHCSTLASLVIPSSINFIGWSAFYGCSALTSFDIPNNVTAILEMTFGECTALVSVFISGSLVSISESAFYQCAALMNFAVSPSNPIYASVDGILCSKDLTTMIKCPEGRAGQLVIPSNVTTIGLHACYDCIHLSSVIIGNNVTSIEIYSFFNCVSLASVTMGSGIGYIGYGAFYFCSSLTSITFLGPVAPYVDSAWIYGTPSELRGHAYGASDFPPPGGSFNGLTMGDGIPIVGSPGQPGNFTAIGGNSQVRLLWAAPADQGSSPILTYDIRRSMEKFGIYSLLAATASPSYIDANVTNGLTYWYQVSAVNTAGEGERTAPSSAVPCTIPGAPTGLIIHAGNTQVTLSWEAPTDNGGAPIDYYVVYQNDVEVSYHLVNSSLIMTGLNNGQDYYFGVLAHNSAGNGPLSYLVNATPFVSVPGVPTLGQSFVGPSIVGIAWSPNGDGNSAITSYRVYRSASLGDAFELIASPTIPSYNDSDVANGQTYWYKVSAVNAIGASANSSTVSANPFTTPDAPAGFLATPGDGQVSLSWNVPVFDGGRAIDYYVVFQDGSELPSHITGLSTLITGLVNGYGHNYTVAAHNVAGIGVQSTLVFITAIGMPEAPTFASIVPGAAHILLTWYAPISDGGSQITEYKLYRSTNSGATYTLLASPTDPTFTDNGLTNGQTYWYKVSAVNLIGEGTQSAAVSALVGIAGMTSHDSGKGYSILVPLGWSAEEDATLGDSHVDTAITGPNSHSVQTSIVVLTGADPTIKDTHEFLDKQIQGLIKEMADQGIIAAITDEPQYVVISNHSAVVFSYNLGSSSVHQMTAIIIDEPHLRYWVITCTESVDARSEFDPTFEMVIYGFAITSVNGLAIGEVGLIVAIAVLGGLAVIGLFAFVMTKKKCPRCGAEVEKSWVACGTCGYQLKGSPPSR